MALENRRLFGSLVVVLFVVAGWSTSARAADASEWGETGESAQPAFGAPKQWVISGAFSVSVDRWFYSESQDESSAVVVAPSLDYFVIENLSVGGNLVFAYADTSTTLGDVPIDRTSTLYGTGLRVGYNVPFSRMVSLWIRPAAGIWRRHVEESAAYYETTTTVVVDDEFDQTALWVDLYLPILIHPTSHFFLGIGPEVLEDVSNDRDSAGGRRHFRGITSMVGGWF